MRPVEQLYRDFCERIALACEHEANLYERHPSLQEEDQQFVRVLREKCRQWRRQVESIEAAHGGMAA